MVSMTDDEITRHFPVRGWRLKCGLRTDLPKKQRVHTFAELGEEQRNSGTDQGYLPGFVYACVRCGFDRFKRERQTA
jgi:hypothetical protein